jgi:hypothetical protein
VVVTFIISLPPGIFVSIADGIAGIVAVIVGIIWLILLIIGAIPSIIAALQPRV